MPHLVCRDASTLVADPQPEAQRGTRARSIRPRARGCETIATLCRVNDDHEAFIDSLGIKGDVDKWRTAFAYQARVGVAYDVTSGSTCRSGIGTSTSTVASKLTGG